MNAYKRHRFPPDIISYAVWLYYRFYLSHRDIEDLPAERGSTVGRESIRLWCPKHSLRSWGRLCIKFGAICFGLAITPLSQAAEANEGKARVQLLRQGDEISLPDAERQYLLQAMERIDQKCREAMRREPSKKAKNPVASLRLLEGEEDVLLIDLLSKGGTSRPALEISSKRDGHKAYLSDCDGHLTLPVATIMAVYATTIPTEVTRHNERRVSSYERNLLGWTYDDNNVDIGYLDATLSFKYRAAVWGREEQYAAYAAFSTRFSQYIGSIESSPVVGKRYNPVMFGRRYFINWPGYVDVGYAHESNGQGISSRDSYLSERAKFEDSDNEPDFARNFLSRGWDYILFDWNHCWVNCPGARFYNGEGAFVTDVRFQYFLDNGLAQGDAEEINAWESEFYDVVGDERRREYDGLSFRADYTLEKNCLRITTLKCDISWEYTTGYDGIFDKSTNRFDFTMRRWDYASVGLWYRRGYNSSLVDYYEEVESYGLSFVFDRTF